MTDTDNVDIAIVGGGYSGTVLAIHLLRAAPRGTTIAVIEPRSELGGGLAYSIDHDTARINVPASLLGVSDDPEDRFIQWLEDRHPETLGPSGGRDPVHTYVARRWFGLFVRDRLSATAARSPARFVHIQGRVADARRLGLGIELALADQPGFPLRARQMVVAASHGPPAIPDGIPVALRGMAGLIADPWNTERLAAIGRDDDVLIVGLGLTMADTVAFLLERGHRGRITAFSRHGLLARTGGGSAAPASLDLSAWSAAPVSRFAARIREEIARAEAQGGSWRDVFTTLREQSGVLWSKLPIWEKRRFLRHLKSFYDVHRYRMAPDIAAVIEDAQQRGQVEILAARLHDMSCTDGLFTVELARRGSPALLRRQVGAVVNCTGPRQRLTADTSHFLGALIARGLAHPDPLGLGLTVDRNFRVYGASENIYALGPLTRERFGDTIGAPEIMLQAQRLAPLQVAALTKQQVAA